MVGFTISSFDREIGATAAEGKKLRKAVSDVFNVAENNLEGSLRRVKNECSILATAKEQDHARYSKILKELRKYASYMRQQGMFPLWPASVRTVLIVPLQRRRRPDQLQACRLLMQHLQILPPSPYEKHP
jgi:hypothetical protein